MQYEKFVANEVWMGGTATAVVLVSWTVKWGMPLRCEGNVGSQLDQRFTGVVKDRFAS